VSPERQLHALLNQHGFRLVRQGNHRAFKSDRLGGRIFVRSAAPSDSFRTAKNALSEGARSISSDGLIRMHDRGTPNEEEEVEMANNTVGQRSNPNRETRGGMRGGITMAKAKAMEPEPITKFAPAILNQIRKEFDVAVSELSKKYGVTIDLGRINYEEFEASAKIKFLITGENGVNAADRQAYLRYAKSLFELQPEWLDKTFERDDETFTIVGLNLRSSKYPVITKTADGKSSRWRADSIIAMMTGVDPIELRLKEARKDYLLATEYTGLKKEWLDQSYKIGNEPLVIVGLRTKGRNELVLVEDRQHKHRLAPIESVIKAMGGTLPTPGEAYYRDSFR